MSRAFSPFPILKVSAAGNDFLLIDLLAPERREKWQGEWAGFKRSALTRTWCDRHEGLGADGMVLLEPDAGADFKWDFWNSDGGPAEMCGNAARAVSLYFQQTYGKDKLTFNTVAGPVDAQVFSPERIQVRLPAVAEFAWAQSTAGGLTYDFVRVGVPHAVVQVVNVDDRARLRQTAGAIKDEPRYRAKGVNVTFAQPIGPESLKSVTFERGVEDFTLACGTGAIAAAYAVARGAENHEIQVQVPGGRLSVIWKNGRPLLTGPAKIVAEMRVVRP